MPNSCPKRKGFTGKGGEPRPGGTPQAGLLAYPESATNARPHGPEYGKARKPGTMKNFLRALRCAWPYRGRLFISIACALVAAALWGLTFGAVSPVLRILGEKQNLQAWFH